MSQPPVVPPRPARSQDKDVSAPMSTSLPKVPPRPIKHRPVSPANPDRFAPSPFNESPFLSKSPKALRSSPSNGNGFQSDPIERSASVAMPSVGEEGLEYDAVSGAEDMASSPEMSHHTVGDDLKLHAPKPSLPAQSAKQRVAAVTRTDSDRAAQFGIGKPSSDEPSTAKSSIKKKGSASQFSGSESHFEGESGIPEIGQRVPMNPFAGDIQAPSPAPISGIAEGLKAGRHHGRKLSARGFDDLPPGSYGLHGHGVTSTDKLEKAYYEKRPELLHRERSVPLHDRQNDFAMPSAELNKLVHQTAARGSGLGTSNAMGTPSEELGYQAHEEYASRMSSPRPKSEHRLSTQLSKQASPTPEFSLTEPAADDKTIHLEDSSARRKSYVQFSDGDSTPPEGGDDNYTAPILADDEVAKSPPSYELQPAVEPGPERRGSTFEMEEPPSRPTSRPASIYREVMHQSVSTPLEEVKEYEPLFPEDSKEAKDTPASEPKKPRHFFPSKDVWEDAPASVHFSAEVSTPDLLKEEDKPVPKSPEAQRAETPAAAFARHQEALAEKESRDPESFLSREQKAVPTQPKWLPPHAALLKEERPGMKQRFPSRDIWEDTPDSLLHETTVSGPQEEEDEKAETMEEPKTEAAKPQVPARPQKKLSDPTTGKPLVPERPKPKTLTASGDDKTIPQPEVGPVEKAKPVVPARPSKSLHSGAESKEQDASSKPKPAVPMRPVSGKIAALQAGFMSDLNNRLKLGPQAPKKEETVAQDLTEEKVEKAPLSDARKGRARGPQRRAPAASPAPVASTETKEEAKAEARTAALSFSLATTCWSIDPEDGEVNIPGEEGHTSTETSEALKVTEKAPEIKLEKEEETEASNPEEHTKTLASNMAGETVVEATVEKGKGDKVDVEDVEEVVKE